MTRLIVTLSSSGHNVEYVHHLYEGATHDISNDYVFAVPDDFQEKGKYLQWEASDNCRFHYFTPFCSGNILIKTWHNCKHLRTLIQQYAARSVAVIALIDFMPFLPLFIPKGVSVSGIVYKIYMYTWKTASWKSRCKDLLRNYLYARCRCFSHVYVLNDQSAASFLNRQWHTSHFTYLADPYMSIPDEGIRDLREELDIDSDKTVILHIGSMMRRKGTLRLLDMIANTPQGQLSDFVFILAGKVDASIKQEFQRRVDSLSHITRIIVRDEFLPYDYVGSLIRTADKVVLPYERTDSSSGIIGYCAQFLTPVYVPVGGLLGKLVRKYRIGREISKFETMDSISDSAVVTDLYCKEHTIERFCNTILR